MAAIEKAGPGEKQLYVTRNSTSGLPTAETFDRTNVTELHRLMEPQGVETTGLVINGGSFTEITMSGGRTKTVEMPYAARRRYAVTSMYDLPVVGQSADAASNARLLESNPKASMILAVDAAKRVRGVSAIRGFGRRGELVRVVASHGSNDYYIVLGEEFFGGPAADVKAIVRKIEAACGGWPNGLKDVVVLRKNGYFFSLLEARPHSKAFVTRPNLSSY